MAMIHCSECRKRVSDKASQCPSCGVSPVHPFRPTLGQQIRAIIIIIVVAGVGGGIAAAVVVGL